MRVKNRPLLTVVVPVYNEQETLPELIASLIPLSRANNWRVVFINDGSTDHSGKILDEYINIPSIRVCHHKINRGYGGSLKTGIMATETPYLVTIDADGQHVLEEIQTLFKAALETKADLAIGNRGGFGSSDFRAFGKWLIRKFTRLLMTIPVSDLNSGFKLYRTRLVKRYIYLCPNSMAFSDIITLIFISRGNLVKEFPVKVRERQGGKSTVTAMTAVDTVLEILNIAMLFNPGRVFYPLSVIFISSGVLWGIPFIILGKGVSTGAMLAIMTGLLFFATGLIASQLSAIRMEALERRD